jgi:hypothetical protein
MRLHHLRVLFDASNELPTVTGTAIPTTVFVVAISVAGKYSCKLLLVLC